MLCYRFWQKKWCRNQSEKKLTQAKTLTERQHDKDGEQTWRRSLNVSSTCSSPKDEEQQHRIQITIHWRKQKQVSSMMTQNPPQYKDLTEISSMNTQGQNWDQSAQNRTNMLQDNWT